MHPESLDDASRVSVLAETSEVYSHSGPEALFVSNFCDGEHSLATFSATLDSETRVVNASGQVPNVALRVPLLHPSTSNHHNCSFIGWLRRRPISASHGSGRRCACFPAQVRRHQCF